MAKPILCLDFDGVIHSYSSGWKGAVVIPDPPVPGALEFMERASEHFEVHVFSSRSNQDGGLFAMRSWLWLHVTGKPLDAAAAVTPVGPAWLLHIKWPNEKPPAMVTIDDRALTFSGRWEDYNPLDLLNFQPWNKRPQPGATGEYPRGKFNADDEGGLAIGVARQDKTVIVNFGKPVAWLGLPKAEALAFADLIIQHAKAL